MKKIGLFLAASGLALISESPTLAQNDLIDLSQYSHSIVNEGEVLDDGILKVAMVSDDPFDGVFVTFLASAYIDHDLASYYHEDLLSVDKDWVYDQDGAATYEISEDKRTITLKIRDGVKWHDLSPVVADDLLFTYEIVGHPDYDGFYYDQTVSTIEGMEAYHAGETDKISGIKVIDDQTISFTFKEANPSILTGLNTTPLKRSYFEGVAIADMVNSEQVRQKPLGFGPYKVKKIVPGEAVLYERFDEYWQGRPKAKNVQVQVVNPGIAADVIKAGKYDIVQIGVDEYDAVTQGDNVDLLVKPDLVYNYLGFKLGHRDTEKNVNVMDPNAKMANLNLRKAMGYAYNADGVAKSFYRGVRSEANSVFTPGHEFWRNQDMQGYNYDPEKAKQLLDEAGYKDIDGDGLREDPNGEKLTINYAAMSGSSFDEPLTNMNLQDWKNVGLDVKLVDDRLIEFNAFYDMVEHDDPKIDVYGAAWGAGSDPDPYGIYGRDVGFNFPRWVSEKSEELLKKGVSPEAFDKNLRQKIYYDWQQLIHDEAPLIPTLYRYQMYAINKRVKSYSLVPGTWVHTFGVTASEPYKAE